jgi:dCTP deaminase
MMLVDADVMLGLADGSIVIVPFDKSCLGTNSYDVHLAPMLRVYEKLLERVPDPRASWLGESWIEAPLDVRKPPKTIDIVIPDEGYVLEPGKLYLASTVEYTETLRCVPMLTGKSSIGRFGLSIHVTAGTGDVGFCGHWTMEMFVIGAPLRIYAGMAIAQLLYIEAREPNVSYSEKPSAKYNNTDPNPQASQYWRNFEAK